ncbi:hypothetical protein QUB61_11695 [Microcoleus sp. C2D2]
MTDSNSLRLTSFRRKKPGFLALARPRLKVFPLGTIQIFPMKLSFVRRLSEQVASAIDEINGVYADNKDFQL